MPDPIASETEFSGFSAFIERNALLYGDKVYLQSIDQKTEITYEILAQTTAAICHMLATSGIRARDRIMLLGGNSMEHAVTFLGVLRYGACVCTVNVDANAAHLSKILTTIGPSLVIYEPNPQTDEVIEAWSGPKRALGNWPDPVDSDPPVVGSPDDPGVIFYTSGTDAVPKGVVYTHATLFHNTDAGMTALDIGEGDRVLDFRSCAWVSAQEIALLGPLVRGATSVLARQFSRSRYLEWIREYRITFAACVPAAISMLLAKPVALSVIDMPTLRYIGSSSAPLLDKDTLAFEKRYGIVVAQSMGSSEMGWITGTNGEDRRPGSAGRATKYQHIEIVDDDGQPVPDGVTGLISVTSDRQRMLGYLQSNGAIEAVQEGPWLSGDFGYLDPEGYLFVTGRASDLINRGGVNIAPLEIDGVLVELSGLADAGTIGVPDPIWGEEVVSYVVLTPGHDLSVEMITAHCRKRLAAGKVPRLIIFQEKLPRTDRGKLDRNALRTHWRMNHAGVDLHPTTNAI